MSAVLFLVLAYLGSSIVLGLPLAVLLGRGIRLADEAMDQDRAVS